MGDVKAFNFDALPAGARGELIENLLKLLGEKSRILCVGSSSLSLARKLAGEPNRSVVLLADPRDFLEPANVEPAKLVVDSLFSPDLPKRFKRDEFDAIILSDPPHEENSLRSQLGNFTSHFENALVISLPEVLSKERTLIREQESEINRLRQLLETREETISWYAKRLREHLVNHYKLEKTHAERMKFEDDYRDKLTRAEDRASMLVHEVRLKQKQHDALLEDRDRIAEYAERAAVYSGDRLPKILRYPVKAALMVLTAGPLEPIRLLRKKKALNGAPPSPKAPRK